jgi:hypothetical protein
MTNITQNIDAAKIGQSIEELEKYIKDDSIKLFITVLKSLKQDPNNEALLAQLTATFMDLGISQGAVLTYAPYVNLLLSDDPFADKQ